MSDAPILLYDATCAFCAANVQFVLAHDGANPVARFGALTGTVATQLLQRRPDLRGADSFIWYEPARDGRAERALTRSDATDAVLRYLGGRWALLGALLSIVPRFARDAMYNLVARHRHRLAGDTCVVPTPEQRSRFLD